MNWRVPTNGGSRMRASQRHVN